MEQHLRNDFTAHYGLPTYTAPNLCIQTSATYFEIEDTETKEVLIHTGQGLGMARFSNPNQHEVHICNYDKFLSEQDDSFQLGKKRTDILVTCDNAGFIVLGELKDRLISTKRKQNKVSRGAKEQLLGTLKTISEVPEISAYITAKPTKRCCYFNKQSKGPTTLTAVPAFNRLSNLYQDGFQMSNPDIEALGFEYWEYTGNQTLRLAV